MIAITGATGQTGSKTAALLLKKKINVRVIGRSVEKLNPFKENGAAIAAGDQGESSFLTGAFTGCDAVYLLIPPKMDTADVRSYYNRLGDVAVEAIRESGVKKVVFLSSLGAELSEGTGPVVGLHDVEMKLRELTGTDIAFLRPAYFMENTFWNIPLIRESKINGSTLNGDVRIPMIATADIAEKAAGLLETGSFTGHTVFDLFGDRISYNELTREIEAAIGKPGLRYVRASAADVIKSLMKSGAGESTAKSFVELFDAFAKGKLHPTRIDASVPNTGTSFRKFAEETFKPAYLKSL